MMVSTKGRYALRVMLDLAQSSTDAYIPLADIAERQGISEKYLESIISVLSKNGFLKALRGKGGGYKLARAPQDYTVGNILKLTEGSLAPVACLDSSENRCSRAAECRTLRMWSGLNSIIDNYVESITIADLLLDDPGAQNYSI